MSAFSAVMPAAKSSALVDNRVIYCGDNLDQLRKLRHRRPDMETGKPRRHLEHSVTVEAKILTLPTVSRMRRA